MTQWQEWLADLDDEFPIGSDGSLFPEIAASLDEGLRDRLFDQLQNPSPVNALYVEDLLRDCSARVAYCLQIRDKAHDLEARAISDALSYRAQIAAANVQKTFADDVAPHVKSMSQNATSATTSGALTQFESSANWTAVAGGQKLAAAALLETLSIKKAKASTSGNGANYAERFAFLKRLFDQGFVEAYRRALVCSKALKRVYNIDIPLPQFKPVNYLDDFAFWAQSASDALSNELDARYVGEIGFSLSAKDTSLKPNELLTKIDYDAGLTSRRLGFRLKPEHFEGHDMTDLLLRSVRIQMVSADTKNQLWSIKVKVPSSDLSAGIEQFSCVAPSIYQENVNDLAIIRGVHNIDPRGDWSIDLPEESMDSYPTTPANLTNVYVLLRVSYKRKQA